MIGLKRFFIFLLALALLPAAALAADMDIPQIDPAAAGIAARPIANADEAIAYAKALWASAYLDTDTAGMAWRADVRDGEYQVTARTDTNSIADLAAYFGADGVVTYLYNGIGRSEACSSAAYDGAGETALAAYLLDFADALNPGSSAQIRDLEALPDAIAYPDRMLIHFNGPVIGGGGAVAMFTVALSPRVHVVDYLVMVPLPPSDNSVG